MINRFFEAKHGSESEKALRELAGHIDKALGKDEDSGRLAGDPLQRLKNERYRSSKFKEGTDFGDEVVDFEVQPEIGEQVKGFVLRTNGGRGARFRIQQGEYSLLADMDVDNDGEPSNVGGHTRRTIFGKEKRYGSGK